MVPRHPDTDLPLFSLQAAQPKYPPFDTQRGRATGKKEMEHLQTLDDDIVNQILALSLLDLSAPETLSTDDVYAAAELAVQTLTRDGFPPARASPPPVAQDRSPPPRNRTLTPPADARDRGARERGTIGWEERREILADSDAPDENGEEGDGEACVACADVAGHPRRRLGCGCHYCAPCLRRCIRTGLRDEESWPPRCHERLAEEDVWWAGGTQVLRLWRQVAGEWDSPVAERIYCARPACAAFIPPGERAAGGEARCGVCGEGTCGRCRGLWHPGVPCDEEDEDEDEGLMNMMDQYGYAACDNCRRIVEILEGCNHITYVSPLPLCFPPTYL